MRTINHIIVKKLKTCETKEAEARLKNVTLHGRGHIIEIR